MIGVTVAIAIVISAILHLYKNAFKKPVDNFPPGPPSLPIYGGYHIMLMHGFRDLAKAFSSLGRKYKTKIVGLYMGPYPTIVVNDPALLRDMLNKPEFDGRVDMIVARLRSYWKKLGIFFTDGYFWQVQRRFSFRYLRDNGLGRRDASLEDAVSTDIKEMIDMTLYGPKYPAEKEIIKDDLILMQHYFTVPFSNALLYVLARSSLPRSEYKTLWDMGRHAVLFQRGTDDLGGALSLTTWLKDVAPKMSGYADLRKGNQFLLEYFERLIKDIMASHNEDHDRHFLDTYIRQMKEEMRSGDKTTFSVEQLALVCVDFMFPAASGIPAMLSMIIERILMYPEVQDKIHEEIDRVVGSGRLPDLDDRKNMPYLESVIREGMRYDTLVPLGVPHRAMQDTTFGGYNIPENTIVSANYVELHMSKEIWGDPQNFRPERFIVNGKLDLSIDKSLPFGAGKRLCAGETFARQSMFQVMAALLQTFKISTHDGLPQKPAKRIQGIVTTLPDYWVRVTPRKST